jgi:hypothetical protein
MKKLQGERLLEWAGDFAAKDFQAATEKDLLNNFSEIAQHLGVQALGDALTFKIGLSQEENSDTIRYGRKRLSELAESIRHFFEVIYFVRDRNIQIAWDETSVLEMDRDKNLQFVKGWKEINLKFYDFGGPDFLDDEGNPKPFKKMILPGDLVPLLYALEGSPLSRFLKCPSCGRIFFHWRKKDRIYCSKKCKGREATRRYREKDMPS